MNELLERVEALLAEEDAEEATKLLLSAAGELGLDDRFHALLNRAGPQSSWRKNPPRVEATPTGRWGPLFIDLDARPNPNHYVFALPELNRVDSKVFPNPPPILPEAVQRDDTLRFLCAGRPVFYFRPTHMDDIRYKGDPSPLGYTHAEPNWRLDAPGVLTGSQESRYDTREYWHRQWIVRSVYRVRGLLLCCRSTRFTYSTPGGD